VGRRTTARSKESVTLIVAVAMVMALMVGRPRDDIGVSS
jgi:hypothetical protein